MKDHYYFDNASTSFPKAPGVAEAMAFYLTEVGGNMGRGDYAPAYDAGTPSAAASAAPRPGTSSSPRAAPTPSTPCSRACCGRGTGWRPR